MFGIGWTEFVLVALVLLVFVGPKHMPGMLRKIGRITAELRAASRDLRNQIDAEVREVEASMDIPGDLGRDLIDDLPSPYAKVQEAETEINRAIKEVADAVKEPAKEPDPVEETAKRDDGEASG